MQSVGDGGLDVPRRVYEVLTSHAEYMRRKVIFLQLLILLKICTEFTRIIFILKDKFFYKKKHLFGKVYDFLDIKRSQLSLQDATL